MQSSIACLLYHIAKKEGSGRCGVKISCIQYYLLYCVCSGHKRTTEVKMAGGFAKLDLVYMYNTWGNSNIMSVQKWF